MDVLIILLVTFAILYSLDRFVLGRRIGTPFIGRAAMAMMLTVTGITHFTSTDWMVAIMPNFMPLKRELVYFTGVCELLAVVGLLWTRFSRLTSVMLIIFFVAILPANIADGLKNDPTYLLFRIPEQMFLYGGLGILGFDKLGRTDGESIKKAPLLLKEGMSAFRRTGVVNRP